MNQGFVNKQIELNFSMLHEELSNFHSTIPTMLSVIDQIELLLELKRQELENIQRVDVDG